MSAHPVSNRTLSSNSSSGAAPKDTDSVRSGITVFTSVNDPTVITLTGITAKPQDISVAIRKFTHATFLERAKSLKADPTLVGLQSTTTAKDSAKTQRLKQLYLGTQIDDPRVDVTDKKVIFGNGSNDPRKLKPEFIAIEVLINVYIVVPVDVLRKQYDDEFYPEGAEFTKETAPLLEPYLQDKYKDDKHVVVRVCPAFPIFGGTTGVQGKVDESTMGVLDQNHPVMAAWALFMLTYYDQKASEFINSNLKDLGEFVPKIKRGALVSETGQGFYPTIPVDDDTEEKLTPHIEKLASKLDDIKDEHIKQPSTAPLGLEQPIPKKAVLESTNGNAAGHQDGGLEPRQGQALLLRLRRQDQPDHRPRPSRGRRRGDGDGEQEARGPNLRRPLGRG